MASFVPSLKGEKVSVDMESRAAQSGAHVAARFDVQSLLGEGGMGSVFVAQDRGLGRIVALKRLREGYEKNREALRRFILEAQIGAQLEHPNIVPLYSFEQSDGGAPAIAMQLLKGTTMHRNIHTAAAAPNVAPDMRGEYSLKERVGMLIGVCEAIHFAHERGVIHRDLKPDNVMLGRYREVYVMDWGLARVTGSHVDLATQNGHTKTSEASDQSVEKDILGTLPTIAHREIPAPEPPTATRQGEVMGTPQYMPPEQALGMIDKVGPAADQYALAVMLQELATLKPARSHTSTMEALSQAVLNHLEPPIDVDDHPVHPALAAIVARGTRQDPAQRYATVQEMTNDIRHFLRDEPVSVFEEGVARRLVRAAARRPALAMGIFSALGFVTSAVIIAAVILGAQRTARQAREMENMRRV